jgi:hypothetical protein
MIRRLMKGCVILGQHNVLYVTVEIGKDLRHFKVGCNRMPSSTSADENGGRLRSYLTIL